MLKKILNNKKGAASYTIISFYRIMMIIIVCLVFVAAIWIQYSKPYDVRKLENAQLAKKLVLCMADDNIVLTQGAFTEKRLNDCVKTDVDVFINLTLDGKSITSGKQELGVYCGIQNKVTGQYLPSCLNYNYSVLNSDYQTDQLNVFIALDKSKENVQMIMSK